MTVDDLAAFRTGVFAAAIMRYLNNKIYIYIYRNIYCFIYTYVFVCVCVCGILGSMTNVFIFRTAVTIVVVIESRNNCPIVGLIIVAYKIEHHLSSQTLKTLFGVSWCASNFFK